MILQPFGGGGGVSVIGSGRVSSSVGSIVLDSPAKIVFVSWNGNRDGQSGNEEVSATFLFPGGGTKSIRISSNTAAYMDVTLSPDGLTVTLAASNAVTVDYLALG